MAGSTRESSAIIANLIDLYGWLPCKRNRRFYGTAEKQPPKPERMEARLTREQKRTIVRAAQISGTTVTGFVVASAQAAATETIRNFEALSLQGEAGKAFVKALLNPPAPQRPRPGSLAAI